MNFWWLILPAALLIAYVIIWLHNKTKPCFQRTVRVANKRSERYFRGLYAWTYLYLTFEDVATRERAEYALPLRDRGIFDMVKVGDRGELVTRGLFYIRFSPHGKS